MMKNQERISCTRTTRPWLEQSNERKTTQEMGQGTCKTQVWEKQLVTALWNCFYHTWAARNKCLHNSAYHPSEPLE
eukprot:4308129-Ditylum_brightwellii.AAC.1